MTRAQRYAILFAGVAGLSMAGTFYKLTSAPVIAVVAYRMTMAVLLTVPLALASRSLTQQGRMPFSRSAVLISAASGAFFALDIMMWATSLQFTTIASAALFVSTQPIFVALLAWALFRERPTTLLWLGIAVGMCGIVVVAGNDLRVSGRALLGDGLATLAALLECGYLLIGRSVRQTIDAPRYTLVVYAAASAVIWLVVLGGRIGATLSPHDLLIAFAMAAIVTVGGHSLVSYSLGYMPAAVVAASFLAQPMLAALLALAFIHQAIGVPTIVGGLIALAGIGIVAYANERRSLLAIEPT